MPKDRFYDLLAVKWFDGLLVKSSHLSHIDARIEGAFSQAFVAFVDQPGLVDEQPLGRPRGQLLEIDGYSKKGDIYEVAVNVTRSFRAVSPSGRLVLGLPNKIASYGIPSTTLSLDVPADREGDFLVCAQQVSADDLSIKAGDESEDEVGLVYPALRLEAAEPERYRAEMAGELREAVPIALITLSGGEIALDDEYLPPVSRLGLVESFCEGLLSSLDALLADLYRLVSGLVNSSSALSAKGKVGAELAARLIDYQILKGLLLAEKGLVRDLSRLSPIKFYRDLACPLAAWALEYAQRQVRAGTAGSADSPMGRLMEQAKTMSDKRLQDLAVGTSAFLKECQRFLEALNGVLGVVA